ncbi:dCTP deaminase [Aureimonas ureilytica]|uniref:dCTP deaminase n=1 Tax=Aureimonas ureilytica TaxID=401562 RepID=UPI00036E99AE|nr:dCTP deaminase [Aureimonas ureilytica]
MTVLSSPTIRSIKPVTPFIEATQIHGMTAGLSHCGYDIRIKDGFTLQSGQFRIASTVERFEMPDDVMAVVHDKSTWARRGLSVFNTVIEPGWKGFLTLELVNNSFRPIEIGAGSPIAQVIFHRLDAPVSGYAGKYQHQADRPVAAILEDA